MRRVTIKSFTGMKNGDNVFISNLLPMDGYASLSSLTNMTMRKQKGTIGTTNLNVVVSICTAAKESIT